MLHQGSRTWSMRRDFAGCVVKFMLPPIRLLYFPKAPFHTDAAYNLKRIATARRRTRYCHQWAPTSDHYPSVRSNIASPQNCSAHRAGAITTAECARAGARLTTVNRLTSDEPGDSQGALHEYPEILQTVRCNRPQDRCAMVPIGTPSPRQDTTPQDENDQIFGAATFG